MKSNLDWIIRVREPEWHLMDDDEDDMLRNDLWRDTREGDGDSRTRCFPLKPSYAVSWLMLKFWLWDDRDTCRCSLLAPVPAFAAHHPAASRYKLLWSARRKEFRGMVSAYTWWTCLFVLRRTLGGAKAQLIKPPQTNFDSYIWCLTIVWAGCVCDQL